MTTASILIVEDEALVGMSFAANLQDAGFSVVGPCADTEEALAAIDRGSIGGAFLDMNLGNNQNSDAIAEALKSRQIPYFFLTGYAAKIPKRKKDFPSDRYLSKPVDEDRLIEAARMMIPTQPRA